MPHEYQIAGYGATSAEQSQCSETREREREREGERERERGREGGREGGRKNRNNRRERKKEIKMGTLRGVGRERKVKMQRVKENGEGGEEEEEGVRQRDGEREREKSVRERKPTKQPDSFIRLCLTRSAAWQPARPALMRSSALP